MNQLLYNGIYWYYSIIVWCETFCVRWYNYDSENFQRGKLTKMCYLWMHLAKIIVHIQDSDFGEAWLFHDLEVLIHSSDTPHCLTAVVNMEESANQVCLTSGIFMECCWDFPQISLVNSNLTMVVCEIRSYKCMRVCYNWVVEWAAASQYDKKKVDNCVSCKNWNDSLMI